MSALVEPLITAANPFNRVLHHIYRPIAEKILGDIFDVGIGKLPPEDGSPPPTPPKGANPDCPTYTITSGTVLYHYVCVGTEWRSVPIGYNAAYTQGPPCPPGSTGTWLTSGVAGAAAGGVGGPTASFTFISALSGSSIAVVCGNGNGTPSLAIDPGLLSSDISVESGSPFFDVYATPDYPNGKAILSSTTASLVIGAYVSVGLTAGTTAGLGSADGLVSAYDADQSQANLAAARSGIGQAASSVFQAMSSEVSSAAQSSTSAVNISDVMGSNAQKLLEGLTDGPALLSGLGEILQSLNGQPLDGGTAPSGSAGPVDYANLQSVENALTPMLGPQFSGIVNLQTFANLELAQINFQTYLLGNIGFFDTSDAVGLENFLRYVADAYASGQPITDASAVPAPSDIDPALLPAFIDRFNRTLQYWSEGVFNTTDVPPGQPQGFLALDTLTSLEQQIVGPLNMGDAALNQIIANDKATVLSVLQTATQLELAQQQTSAGTCATVKVGIDQSVVMSRSAFNGTLTIDPNEAMNGISLDLVITDQNGNVVDPSVFGITNTSITGVSALDGSHPIAAGDEVTSQYTFVPSLAAAANGPMEYSIGGTITFNEADGDGVNTVALAPVTVTVLPQPALSIDYFLSRNVFGDDPTTPNVVEASQPFMFGMQVHNVGAGDADSLTINSAQPQIVDNLKGLDINFQILGSELNGAPGGDSLDTNFGIVRAGTTQTADWSMESSLQGKFIDYSASFSNVDPFGLKESSVIQGVRVHELIHGGDVNGDGVTDFLVDDVPNPLSLPDALYLSNGATAPVTDIGSTAQTIGDQNGVLTVEVATPTKAAEWDYFDALVPADGSYAITSVTRADGTALAPGQYWFTDRTFSNTSTAPVYENRIHILDALVSGSYLVTFTKTPTPGVSDITIGLTNDTGASPVDQITHDSGLFGLGAPNAIVRFAVDGTTIGDTAAADSTGLWNFTPSGFADGAHVIVASETDAAGHVGTATLNFVLDTTFPAVTEALQADTGTSSTDNITSNPALTGTGAPNAIVRFSVDGSTIGDTATANANGAWNFTPTGLTPGVHRVLATETDTAGNTGLASLTFTLQTGVPTLSLALAADTGISSTDHVTSLAAITGVGDANDVISLAVDGTDVAHTITVDASGGWSYTPTELADGPHTIVAAETDAVGNVNSASLSFILQTAAPKLGLGLLADTGVSATDDVTSNPSLSGTGSANASLAIAIDGVTAPGASGVDGAGNWTFAPTGLADGVHTVVATETDLAGNAATASLTFTLDTVAPAVTETFAEDVGVPHPSVIKTDASLLGTGDPGALVTFSIDGVAKAASVTAGADGAWSFTPSGLSVGSHTISAGETDAAGIVGSATRTFYLVTPGGGPIHINSTLDNRDSTLAVGTGSAIAQLVIDSGGVVLGGIVQDGGSDVAFQGGVLDGVTYEGTLDLSLFGSSVTIVDGATLTGAGGTGRGAIEDTGYNSQLYLSGTETLDNVTIDVGNGANNPDVGSSILNYGGGTVTLGADVTIDHVGYRARLGYSPHIGGGSGSGTIVNDGTIDADLSGGSFIINPTSFANNGIIAVSNGDALTVNTGAASFTNDGAIGIDGGGRFDTQGAVSGSGGIIDIATGGALAIGGTINGQTFDFLDGNGRLTIGDAADSTISLLGFQAGDTVDLGGLAIAATSYSNGTLSLLGSDGSTLGSIALTGDYSAETFYLNADGSGGTNLTVRPTMSGSVTVPTNGLIGFWTGNGNANDSSPTGNNGTFNGSYAAGVSGEAFDLSSDSVDIPTGNAYDNLGAGFSTGFWFNFNGKGNGPWGIVGRDSGGGENAKWVVFYNYAAPNAFEFHVNGQGSVFLNANPVPIPSGWNQFTVTDSGTDFEFYLNGANIGSVDFAGTFPTFPKPTDLQFGIGDGASAFRGLLENVVLYDRALTPAEVSQLSGGQPPLPITIGAHTAKIALMGQYMSSSFVASSDGHGGVVGSVRPRRCRLVWPCPWPHRSVTLSFGRMNPACLA